MNIASYIDHTILKPATVIDDVRNLCSEAKEYGFAAVCVPPPFVKSSKNLLKDSSAKVATVIGFPLTKRQRRLLMQEPKESDAVREWPLFNNNYRHDE